MIAKKNSNVLDELNDDKLDKKRESKAASKKLASSR